MSIIFTSRKVLLPGYETPHTAAIVVDKASGKIVDVKKGPVTRQDFPQASTNDWIDAGDKWILPGLVEYVRLISMSLRYSKTYSQRACPSKRTRSHGLGGFLHRYTGSCFGWSNYGCGHAS